MGKPSNQAPPPPAPPAQDNTALLLGLAGMFEALSSQNEAPELPDLPEPPELERTEPIDFSSRQDAINAQASAQFGIDQASKKGRRQTILSSLVEDEEPDTTDKSLLTA